MQPNLSGKKIMIAPLDWGLGHATRCIPIIDELLQQGAIVHLGGDGASYTLLKEAYPFLPAHDLPAYNIEYPSGTSGAWKTLFKAPDIIKAIKEERKVVDQIALQEGLDAIISDNRYGAHTPRAHCVFMCHQLRVLPPKGLRWGAPIIFRWHKSFFGNFDSLWIPDYENAHNLSGILSHGLKTDLPTYFIGPQSRFSGLKVEERQENYVAVVLSGPEPQRSILEEILTQQLIELGTKAILVRGVVEKNVEVEIGLLKKVNYLHKEELFKLLSHASWVICRPGYSTLMDLSLMQKKALLIPTPGQTEQEYLAENLAAKGAAIVQVQKKIDVKNAIEQLEKVNPIPTILFDQKLLEEALFALAEKIKLP